MSGAFPVYVRKRPLTRLDRLASFRFRVAMRASAVLFLGVVIGTGLLRGGHFDYDGSKWLLLPGKAASLVGLAAEDITITGLEHHEPEVLLAEGVDEKSRQAGQDHKEADADRVNDV